MPHRGVTRLREVFLPSTLEKFQEKHVSCAVFLLNFVTIPIRTLISKMGKSAEKILKKKESMSYD